MACWTSVRQTACMCRCGGTGTHPHWYKPPASSLSYSNLTLKLFSGCRWDVIRFVRQLVRWRISLDWVYAELRSLKLYHSNESSGGSWWLALRTQSVGTKSAALHHCSIHASEFWLIPFGIIQMFRKRIQVLSPRWPQHSQCHVVKHREHKTQANGDWRWHSQ